MAPTTTPLDPVHDAADATHDALLDVVTTLLDNYYEAKPYSNAFGCDYEAPASEPDGVWYMGRADGADGADKACGVDYIVRKHPDPENPRQDESHYLFGDYGWMTPSELIDERAFLSQVIDTAIEQGYLDAHHQETFTDAFDQLEAALKDARESTSLADIKQLIGAHDTDALKTLVASDDEEGRVIWQLLHSKDENDEIIDNEVTVPVCDDDAGLLFARAERYFHDEYREPDGKYYAYGAVIGIDDTDEIFFVHRLESDPDLRDADTEWTTGMVMDKMGFDVNYDDLVAPEDLPFDTTVRLQGDVALTRYDYRTKLWAYYETEYEAARNRLVSDQLPSRTTDDYPSELQTRIEDTYDDIDGISVGIRSGRITPRPDDTDGLKDLQDALDIAEDTVRDEQERRGIQRLTAKRRSEIIEDLVFDQLVEWACDIAGQSEDALQADVDERVHAEFADTNQQVNLILGNHTVILGPAREHPDTSYPRDNDCLAAVVVPEEATGFVWHDEHENKKITLPKGVYEFHFLQGHEDQWWMSN